MGHTRRENSLTALNCPMAERPVSRRNRLTAFVLIACVLCLILTVAAAAQEINQPPQSDVVGTTSDVPQPPQLSPSSPQGETPYDPSKPPTGYKPTPAPTVPVTGGVNVPIDNNNLKLDADFWRVDFPNGKTVVTARGNVRATYREFMVTSNTASADLRTRTATFSDNVVLTLYGQEVRGTQLYLNLDTRAWSFQSAQSKLRPELFPEIIRAPVFLTGKTISGLADQEVEVQHGGFTTCDLKHPHFFIDAGSVSVWPSQKLVARDTAFYALGRMILKLPRIAVPIRQITDHPALMPRVGQTAEEGFFLKSAYTLLATQQNTGNLKLDMMSQKGIGIGIEDNYTLTDGRGSLYAYQLSDQNRDLNTLTGRFSHDQQLGTIKATLTTDYRANSYQYSSGSTSLGNQVQLSRTRTGATSNLGMRYSLDHGFGRFANLTSNLLHNQVFSERGSADFGFDYFRSVTPIAISGGTVDAANSQLVSRGDYGYRGDLVDWHLRVNKINDLSDEAFISQSGARFAGTERLPELELTTSTDRLKRNLPLGLPARLGFAVGQYREDLGRVDTSRAAVDVDVPPKIYRLADKLNLTAAADFRQYVYGDDTAQYSISTSMDLDRRIGEKSSASLNYRYLRPRGFTPFRFDFIGKYNILNARLNYQETERLRFSVYGGYDFDQPDFNWQDLTARVSYAPSEKYLLFASTGYDLNRHRWRSLVNQFRVRLAGDFRLDVGSSYDIETGKFGNIKSQLDTPVGKNWHVRANAGYNGFTQSFDYANVQVVRDLHCWEMALTYVDQNAFWQERGLKLSLRIKAFPIFDTFGVGQFGQALDTSVGEVL